MITRIGTYSQIKGVSVSNPCIVATTASITLNGTQTIDGIGVVVGNRVLVKNQSPASNNGIYIVSSGTWTRAIDMSIDDDIFQGLQVFINSGTVNGSKIYVLSSANPLILGSSSLSFVIYESNPGAVTSFGAIGASPNANAGTISSGVITLQPASALFGGVVTTGTQTIAGTKTFSSDLIVNTVNIGLGGGNINSNTLVGSDSLNSNTTGNSNTALGDHVLPLNTTGSSNSAVGRGSLEKNTTAFSNTGFGNFALFGNTTGSQNTAVGSAAGGFIADGTTENSITNFSVYIGNNTRASSNNQTNQIVIGYNAIGNGSNTVTIGNTSITDNYFQGNIRGTSFIKTGGTSSQFLKADGSVDSTAYQSTVSFGAIGASPNANGGSISSGVITLQPASISFGGIITTGTQTIAGAKTLTGALSVTPASGTAIQGIATIGTGVYGEANSIGGVGVVGRAYGTNGAGGAFFANGSASYGLQANSTASPNAVGLLVSANSSTGFSSLYVSQSGTSEIAGFYNSGGNVASISNAGKYFGTALGISGNTSLGTTSGYLEVGYTTPQGVYKLDVNGTMRVAGAATFSSSVTANGNLGFINANASQAGIIADYTGTGALKVSISTYNDNFNIYNETNTYSIINFTRSTKNLVINPTGGNLGIGTTSPDRALTVNGNISLNNDLISTKGGTNFRIGYESYIATGGVNLFTESAVPLVFGTSSTERMRITSVGNVTIGDSSTSNTGKLSYVSPGFGSFNGVLELYHSSSNVNGSGFVNFYFNGSVIGSIGQLGTTAVVYNTTSDYRLKEDLQEVKGLEKVQAIKVYDYKWIKDEYRMDGVLAHELQEVLPYAVTGEKDALDEEGNEKMQGVDYSKIVPILIKAIQEQQKQIEDLQDRLN